MGKQNTALKLKPALAGGKIFPLLLIVFFFLFSPYCHAQTSVEVSEPRLMLEGNTLWISYDIINSNPGEKYNISIEVKDEDGRVIQAKSLTGHIGLIEEGGSNKLIKWDLEADNVFINSYVYVKINASVIAPPKPIITQPDEEEATSNEVTPKSFNRTLIILQSVAVPGLGLSRVTGKPHWLKGIAGYGCLAGSIILNRQSISTFNGISDLDDPNDVDDAFNKSVQQDNISEVLSYVAIGVWVSDIIWTVLGTSDLKVRPGYAQTKGFSLMSNIDPLSNIPLFSIRYSF